MSNEIRVPQVLVIAPLLLGAIACVRSESTTIPNPLKAGQVQQNRIKNPDRAGEARFSLPSGTLFHEASLVALDEEQICFDVVLRVDGQRRGLATPEGWRVFLRGKPEFEDKAPRFGATSAPEETSVPGVIETRSTANQRICDSNGDNCYTKDVVITSHTPGQIPIVKAGGLVCFANQGHVTKATQQITLHLDDPNPPPAAPDGTTFTFGGGNLMNRVGFEWKFIDGPVTAPMTTPSALALSPAPTAPDTTQSDDEAEAEAEPEPQPEPKRAAAKNVARPSTKSSAPPQSTTKKAPKSTTTSTKSTTLIDYVPAATN